MPIRDSVILTPDRLHTVVDRFMERPAFSQSCLTLHIRFL